MQIYRLEPRFCLPETSERDLLPSGDVLCPTKWAPVQKACVLTPGSSVLLRTVSELGVTPPSSGQQVSGRGRIRGGHQGGLQRVRRVSAPRGVTEHSPALQRGRGQAFRNHVDPERCAGSVCRAGRFTDTRPSPDPRFNSSNVRSNQSKRRSSPLHFQIKTSKPVEPWAHITVTLGVNNDGGTRPRVWH